MSFLNKYFFHSPMHYLAALVMNIVLMLIVLFLNGFDKVIYYVNACSVAGAISVLWGMLLCVTAAGAFHTFGYAISTFRAERKYQDLYEYTVAKEEKNSKQKKTYMAYIVVGVVFLLISYVLSNFIAL